MFSLLSAYQSAKIGAMSNGNRFWKHMDLSVQHLAQGQHYVSPRERKLSRIERYRRLPRGVVGAERQQDGAAIGALVLHYPMDEPSRTFALRMIAAAGMNTASYSLSQGSEDPVMRRRLYLPLVGGDEDGYRPNADELLAEGKRQLDIVSSWAADLVVSAETGNISAAAKRDFGRAMGNVCLTLSSVAIADRAAHLSPVDAQGLARQQSLATMLDARTLGDRTGVHPSLRQLSDPDSPLSVHWRRNAPNDAYDALEWAVASSGLAA